MGETAKGDRRAEARGSGTLYLVATPLGHVGDMSPRAGEILGAVDYIAAEDTRRAARLLSSLGVGNRLVSYYEQNKALRERRLLDDLLAGLDIALISDAGMPCISDPGSSLVRQAVRSGIRVSVIPGPSAFLSALAASGLDTARFVFEGFLPVKGKDRFDRLEAMGREGRTMAFYEAPHRLRKTLTDLKARGLGERLLVLARELTKPYEEWLYLTVDQACRYYEKLDPKGEYSLVLEGLLAFRLRMGMTDDPAWPDDRLKALLQEARQEGLRTREAVDRLVRETGLNRRRLYQLALGLQEENAGEDEPDPALGL